MIDATHLKLVVLMDLGAVFYRYDSCSIKYTMAVWKANHR